jgi:hypothetical protein
MVNADKDERFDELTTRICDSKSQGVIGGWPIGCGHRFIV